MFRDFLVRVFFFIPLKTPLNHSIIHSFLNQYKSIP
nr:MAG TPA: hypothetical protein [Caudoviricetes sp.]